MKVTGLKKKTANNQVIGYDTKGNPISLQAFITRIKKAESQVAKGKYVTLEELEKESEKW